MTSGWRVENKAAIDNYTLKALFFSEDWVFILVDAIAMRIAHLPLNIYLERQIGEKTDYQLSKGHPMARLLANPNQYQDKTAFVYSAIVEYLLGGNNIIWRAPLANMLVNLPFELVQYRFDNVGRPIKLYFYPNGYEENGLLIRRAEPFEIQDIIHIRRPNPASVYWGLSPFIPGRRSVLFNRYSQDYLNAYYLKGATPQFALTMDVEAKSDKITRLLRTFEQTHTGRKNMRRTMLLPKGVDVKSFETKIADQQLVDLINNNREVIMNILHVPKQALSLQESGSIGSEEHRYAMKQFWLDVLVPTANMWSDALSHALRHELGSGYCARFDVSGVDYLQENESDKIELATKALAVMTLNEARQKYLGMPPRADGDYIGRPDPFALVEPATGTPELPAASQAPSEGDVAVPADANIQTTPEISLNGAQVTSLISVVNQVATGLLPRDSGVALIQAAFSLPLDAAERIMGEVGRSFFVGPQQLHETQNPATGKDLATHAPEIKAEASVEPELKIPTVDPMEENIKTLKDLPVKLEAEQIPSKKTFATEQLKAQYEAVLKELSKSKGAKAKKLTKKQLKTAIETTQDTYLKAYQKTFEDNVKQGQESQLKVIFRKQDKDTLEAIMAKNEDGLRTTLEMRGLESFKSIADTTAENAMKIIEAGIANSDSAGKISNDLEKRFGELLEYRADTIARTETLTAVSLGQNFVVEQASKVIPGLKKMWLTAGDDDVRDSHAEMDGTTIDVDEDFNVGGERMYGPRTGGSAGNVINCRCVLLMVTPKDEE